MRWNSKPTLIQLFVLATVGITALVGGLFFLFLESSRASILARSDALRDAAARDIGARVAAELDVASQAVDEIQRAVRMAAVKLDDPVEVEELLFTELINHKALSDITLTRAKKVGYDAAGQIAMAPEGRQLLSVYRVSADPDSPILTRRVTLASGRYVAEKRTRPRGGALLSAPFIADHDTTDPTDRPAFRMAASEATHGAAVWSDLHFSPFDAALPAARRRVGVDLQSVIDDAAGQFIGVVRVGLLTQTIDALPQRGLGDAQPDDPRRAFLCDAGGHLVTRPSPDAPLEQIGDDVRVSPSSVPPAIAIALASPALREVSPDAPQRSAQLDVAGERFLVTFRALESTPGWLVGVLAPENFYTKDLLALRDRFLVMYLVVSLIVLLGGGLALRTVQRALGSIRAATTRMRHFDFSASSVDVPFQDVSEVIDELERAKTAMRALSKYVPIDLVRELHETNREPALGGELRVISLMFTDIQGFTTLSERLAPDALAQALGRYLEAMSAAIRATNGTVDKYIGDAVMTFWNAPTEQVDHAKRACRAAVACRRATRALYASPDWKPLEPLVTRFGIHKARVMVGHFGAPERLSYTALGDGVNVAARLEGLCKQYEVDVLASETIVEDAKDEFAFRLVDKVAVKGRHEAVQVYELLGTVAEAKERRARLAKYEEALGLYFGRDFAAAIALLETLQDDGPSRVLCARCKALLDAPPREGWDGVFFATTK